MAKYTTQIKSIIEHYSNPELTIIERIKEAAPKIFNFDYPIWDNEYKQILETKILTHYFSKEIGLETVGLWKLYLYQRMNEIMPYYNDLYLSTTQKYSEAYDMDIKETLNRTANGENQSSNNYHNEHNGTNSNTINGNNKILNLAYPQAQVEGEQNNLFYGTDGSDSTETTTNENNQNDVTDNTSQSSGTTTTNEEHTITRKGISGSKTPWEIIREYRNSLINIDLMIINELKDLFMMVY